MKPLRRLINQVEQWHQEQRSLAPQLSRLQQLLYTVDQAHNRGSKILLRKLKQTRLRALAELTSHPNGCTSPKHKPPHHRAPKNYRAAATAVVVLLTATVGQRFYNQPRLSVGTIAPQTFKAPESAQVIDIKTTEEKRKAAQSGSLRILTLDQETNREISQTVQQLLSQGSQMRQQVGTFPFIETSVLSSSAQTYLRQVEEWEWRAILAAATSPSNRLTGALRSPASLPGQPLSGSLDSAAQQRVIQELRAYYTQASEAEFEALKTTIRQARQRYTSGLTALEQISTPNTSNPFGQTLFDLSDSEWQATRTGIRQAVQRMTAQGIAPGTPPNLLEKAVKLQIEGTVPTLAQSLATSIVMRALQPNLIEDPEQTRLAAERAAEAVEPEIVAISEGSIIVEAGAEITQADFVLLDHFNLSRRGINWLGFIGFGMAVGGGVILFLWVENMFHPGLRRRDHLLIVMLTLSTPLMAAVGFASFVSLPAVGLLVGSFYGSALSITVVGLLAALLPIGLEVSSVPLVASAIAGMLGGVVAGRLRSREELALLGGAVGLTQGMVYLLLTLILTPSSSPIWYILLANAGIYGLVGLAWSIVALGVSPYLEHVFDLVTAIRLAELSNPNRPLLKRLASEAPGTFQHTMFVASLAEAAARSLGCNVELVRAGTLYHDIGKMHDPLGFIENQMGGPNKHDAINDPWKSAAIIKKHVTEGLVMARKHRLPKAVRAFIPEHQGTMLITFFHHQALEQAKADHTVVVHESDFRYDGPIPQSRETGIVMLADSCEAALRSLKDTTPEEALAMVNRILRARWKDDQLVESGLSREDMSRIAEIFVRVWQQFNHQRIPYPKAALASKKVPQSS